MYYKEHRTEKQKTTFVFQMLHLFCVTLNTLPFSKDSVSRSAKWVGWWTASWPQSSHPGPLSGNTKLSLGSSHGAPHAARIPGHCILTSHAEVNLAGIWILPEVRSELKDQNWRGLWNLGKD